MITTKITENINKINNANVDMQSVKFKDKIVWAKKKPIITGMDDDKYFRFDTLTFTSCLVEKGYLYVYYKTKDGRDLSFFKNNKKTLEQYDNPRRIVLNSKGDNVVELELKYKPSVDFDKYFDTAVRAVISEYMLTDEDVKECFKS